MALLTRSATGAPGGGQYASYASDSASGFIPQIWSPLLTEQFYDHAVFGDISNTNYQSEIQGFGDSVKIRSAPKITVTDHEIGADIYDDYEVPTSTTTLLEINQAKKFAVQLDEIDSLQSDIDLQNTFIQNAGFEMATEVDTELLANTIDDASATNKGDTAGRLSGDIALGTSVAGRVLATGDDVLDLILDAALVLDESKMPRSGSNRFIVLPNWAIRRVKRSDIQDASAMGDSSSPLRNGMVGRIDDFDVYGSNLLPVTAGNFSVIAGHRSAMTFASQVDQHTLDVMKSERKFGWLMRGMTVYGQETIIRDGLVNIFAAKS